MNEGVISALIFSPLWTNVIYGSIDNFEKQTESQKKDLTVTCTNG